MMSDSVRFDDKIIELTEAEKVKLHNFIMLNLDK